MTERVVVFIDAQNTYMGAREAFFPPSAFHAKGNIDPYALGRLLAARQVPGRHAPRRLEQARIYTGKPTARDPKGYGPSRRRHAKWTDDGAIVVGRPLRYPANYPSEKAQEKGVDVALALDVVVLALRDVYDVGIVVSSDTDLRPAVEYVLSMPEKTVEVAAWKGRRPLEKPGDGLWCHWLSEDDYNQVADLTDYNVQR